MANYDSKIVSYSQYILGNHNIEARHSTPTMLTLQSPADDW